MCFGLPFSRVGSTARVLGPKQSEESSHSPASGTYIDFMGEGDVADKKLQAHIADRKGESSSISCIKP